MDEASSVNFRHDMCIFACGGEGCEVRGSGSPRKEEGATKGAISFIWPHSFASTLNDLCYHEIAHQLRVNKASIFSDTTMGIGRYARCHERQSEISPIE